MDIQKQQVFQPLSSEAHYSSTLSALIDSIQFTKKPKQQKNSHSQTDSFSSSHEHQIKQKSKIWTEQENQMFHIMIKKFGTDFNILKPFFPQKTKNQLKNKYKQIISFDRKKNKLEEKKLQAVSKLFKDIDEKSEKEEKQEEIN